MKYKVMKNRNLILSVLLWVVCSSVFAVTLPTSSYVGSSSDSYNESYTFSIGTSFRNTAVLTSSSYEYSCVDANYDKNDNAQLIACERCCDDKLSPCIATTGNPDECFNANLKCINECENGPSLPLGTPLMLLPFIALYALVRRRKQA